MLNNVKDVTVGSQPIDCAAINKEVDVDFIEKVNTGLYESALGLVNTKEEAKQKLSRWL